MATDILVPTGDTVRTKIVERIRASFVELIPEDQWIALVDAEIKQFTQPPGSGYYSYQESRVAPLRLIVREELDKLFRAKLVALLSNPDFQPKWSDKSTDMVAGEFVKTFLTENVDLIAKAAFGQIMQNAVDTLRSSLQVR